MASSPNIILILNDVGLLRPRLLWRRDPVPLGDLNLDTSPAPKR